MIFGLVGLQRHHLARHVCCGLSLKRLGGCSHADRIHHLSFHRCFSPIGATSTRPSAVGPCNSKPSCPTLATWFFRSGTICRSSGSTCERPRLPGKGRNDGETKALYTTKQRCKHEAEKGQTCCWPGLFPAGTEPWFVDLPPARDNAWRMLSGPLSACARPGTEGRV